MAASPRRTPLASVRFDPAVRTGGAEVVVHQLLRLKPGNHGRLSGGPGEGSPSERWR